MVQYVSTTPNQRPVKRQPFQPSSAEWSALANHCHDIEPTNSSRKHIIRSEDWVKETWNDCRKYLHQTFIQYHRSGQHDSEMDEWCSKKELDRWVRATNYKTPGQNSVIRFPTAMAYSICVLDVVDFEGIGRQMPSGTGIDASLQGSTAGKARGKHGKNNKGKKNNNKVPKRKENQQIAQVIESIGNTESRLAALQIIIEFGSAEDKRKALSEVQALVQSLADPSTDASNVDATQAQSATPAEVASISSNEIDANDGKNADESSDESSADDAEASYV
jgi:hypothetical protein